MLVDVTSLSRAELLEEHRLLRRHTVEQEQILIDQRQSLAEQQQKIATYEQKLSQQQALIERLQRIAFGSKRERFVATDAQQILLEFVVDAQRVAAAVEQEAAKITVEYTRNAKTKHPGRLPLPEHLEVEEFFIEPEVDTTGMTRIGEEVTSELGFEPARLFIRRLIRAKYITPERDDASQSGVIAPLPPRPIDKCEAGVDLLAAITIDKHLYHIPVYRQLERFAALGVRLPASTVDGWQRMTGLLLRPLHAALRELITQTRYLQVDETGLAVQDRDRKGATHRGFLWAYHAPIEKLIYFDYQRGRGRINCRDMLGEYSGFLQTDGYAAYQVHKTRDGITPLACWAHVRRKFFEARTNDQVRADAALSMIGKLYDVERDAREQGLCADERKELRLEKALPTTNAIGAWLVEMIEKTTPKSPIGAAVRYALSLWSELENYLHDGHLEIDNNLIENAIRPIAIGRKNYLFAGSHDAAINIAMYRSFFATCRLNGVDEQRWLTYVLTAIRSTPADAYHTLLPQNTHRSLLG